MPTRFGRTHALVSGPREGLPLTLLHGLGTSATVWYKTIEAFSRDFRVYALDTIGDAGRSVLDNPADFPHTAHAYAVWLVDTLDELGIGKTNLVGLSYGGWIGLHFARLEPGRVRKLAAISSVHALAEVSVHSMLRLAASAILPTPWTTDTLLTWLGVRRPHPAFVEQLVAARRVHWKVSWLRPLTDDELNEVHTPTLLLLGAREALVPQPGALLDRARQWMPQVEAELIPAAGHLLPIDRPDVVTRRILGFLETPLTWSALEHAANVLPEDSRDVTLPHELSTSIKPWDAPLTHTAQWAYAGRHEDQSNVG